MPENVLAKLTSLNWLKEAIGGRAKNFVHSITFAPSTIERNVAGEKYQFYIGNVTGKSWYNDKTDVSYEMTFVKNRLIKPGDVVIECGAHHGAQTILLSRWVGNHGKVIAIEPIPENITILKRNIEINELTNVILVEKAAGASCGKIFMRSISNGAVSPAHLRTNSIQVESVTLDKLVEELDILPSFLKIDVEGYEYQILEGSKAILSNAPAVFVEVHPLTLPRYRNKFEDLWTLIEYSRYDIFIQRNDSEEPVIYSPETTLVGRAHLFFKPRGHLAQH
jgi:FkbM family methyltransferase